jgi:hypothetical protein
VESDLSYRLFKIAIAQSGETVPRLLCDPLPYKNVLKYCTRKKTERFPLVPRSLPIFRVRYSGSGYGTYPRVYAGQQLDHVDSNVLVCKRAGNVKRLSNRSESPTLSENFNPSLVTYPGLWCWRASATLHPTRTYHIPNLPSHCYIPRALVLAGLRSADDMREAKKTFFSALWGVRMPELADAPGPVCDGCRAIADPRFSRCHGLCISMDLDSMGGVVM